MYQSHLISSLSESATLAVSKKVRELKAAGRDVIGLTLGEPDFDTPKHIRAAAKEALDDGYTHYPPVAGLPELKAAIIQKFEKDNNLTYASNQIVVSTGAKQSLYNVVQVLLNPGDEVVIPAPFWVSYSAMVHLAQAKVVMVPTGLDTAFKVTPERLEEAITPKTRLLMLSSPSNPSGSMYSQEEFAALVAVLEKYPQVYVISDEIYEHLTYGKPHVSIASFDSMYDRVITVNGFSKSFAMTGWRLGYLAASQKIAALCEKLQGQVTSGANAFAQKGAVKALTGSMEPTYTMREAFRKRRDMMHQALSSIDGLETNLPDGAFYFYPDISSFFGKKSPNGEVINTPDELCLYLIDSVGLALIPGTAFGTPDHVRISYAYSEETLKESVARLADGLGRLG